jgi:hypothetical protein
VLLDAGRDREHVRVEDDVLGVEPLLDQEPVRALADLDPALDRDRLALLVEGHYDRGRTEPPDRPSVGQERFLAFLQADRVGDPLPLDALEPRFDRREAGAVDHDRHPGDLRLGGDHVQERGHRLLGVEQVGVHVHVDQVRAALHLLERDRDRPRVVIRLDQPAEARRAGHVRALADHHEAGLPLDLERLQTAEARHRPPLRNTSGGKSVGHGPNGLDVLRRRAAAAADDVHQPRPRELPEEAAGVGRLLVVLAEGVRQARVGMA